MSKAESSGGNASQAQLEPAENQIVVYQPNETVRLDVRLENETVWLTQSQMAILFGCSTDNIGLHLKNVYAVGELSREATTEDFSVVRKEGARQVRRNVTCYNLDAIISVGYRVNSILGVKFRQWATRVLKEFLLRGYSVNSRLNQLEDKMDRRLAKHDGDIADLKEKVDFFVQTKEPPLQGIFYQGRYWDAKSLLIKFIRRAPQHRRRENGRRNHPRASRLNPQGGIGTPRIRQAEIARMKISRTI